MNSKLVGGILLVIGTTIGAGMLALPVATAKLGFFSAVILLVSCWLLMTICAFLFLEVNLWFPPSSNLISMAGATLGKTGQGIAWIFYLVLLYSIISAYISGGGDVLHYLLVNHGVSVPLSAASILFTVLFGSVVYLGIHAVDYVNRSLMFGKMIAFVALVILIFPSISWLHLTAGHFKYIIAPTSMTVTAVAFGSLMIIPSLRVYFNDDLKSLRCAIFIGMLIPLLCYIAWEMVIMGVIPFLGHPGLREIAHSPNTNSQINAALTSILQNKTITLLINFFTSICMATTFLSISLSLSDFLADGFQVEKRGTGSLLVYSATFLPPLVAVLFSPGLFIRGLNYAGVSTFILMILMPPLMVWRGRYHHDLATVDAHFYGGKWLLVSIVCIASVLIGLGVEGTF